MVNLACVDSGPFAAILAGRKRTEWRFRSRPDPRLEAIQIGEPIILYERGKSTRVIRAIVRATLRFDYHDGHVYAIRLADPQLGSDPRPHPQGWLRQ